MQKWLYNELLQPNFEVIVNVNRLQYLFHSCLSHTYFLSFCISVSPDNQISSSGLQSLLQTIQYQSEKLKEREMRKGIEQSTGTGLLAVNLQVCIVLHIRMQYMQDCLIKTTHIDYTTYFQLNEIEGLQQFTNAPRYFIWEIKKLISICTNSRTHFLHHLKELQYEAMVIPTRHLVF